MTTVHNLNELDGQPHANVFPDAEPKTIKLTLDAGGEVPSHSHPDREIVFYLIEGTIELRNSATRHASSAARDIVRFDGDQEIAPHAVEESTALIVLASRSDE